MKLVRYLVAPVVLAVALATFVSVGRAKATTIEFWMSPGAAGSGLTQADPAGTFDQVQKTIQANNPGGVDIQVRMAPDPIKTYVQDDEFTWTVSNVEFLPWSYNGGGWPAVYAEGGYPVIDGACYSTNSYILDIDASYVNFTYIKFENRLLGLVQPQPGTTGDSFYGDYFTNVGTATPHCTRGTQPGYGAVLPDGSTDWSIINCHFVNLVNSSSSTYPADPGAIHGIYAEHGESHGIVENNAFQNISGDPVRFRDDASYNTVSDNTFTDTGNRGYIGDWYDTSQGSTEQPSHDNDGSGNTWGGYYDSTPPQTPDFCYDSAPSYVCNTTSRMDITGS
jgi:hypothetical protein